jgi:hypothetical protein
LLLVWNGLELGTESLRLGVFDAHPKVRGWQFGECMPDENRGLLVPIDTVADVGVLYPVGELLPTV